MIQSKDDYKKYLEEDRIANEYRRKRPRLVGNEIWKFLIALRRYEYHKNCIPNGEVKKIICLIDKFRWHRLSVKTGITIYPNTFEEGLTIWHYGCIVCNGTIRAGKRVTLQCGVNIAENVIIGNDCYLAPGVKIGKNVIIPENCVVGYNSVVTRSLEVANATYIGSPAKLVKKIGYVKDGKRLKL